MDSYILTTDGGLIGSIFIQIISTIIMIGIIALIFFVFRFFYLGSKLFKVMLDEKMAKDKEIEKKEEVRKD